MPPRRKLTRHKPECYQKIRGNETRKKKADGLLERCVQEKTKTPVPLNLESCNQTTVPIRVQGRRKPEVH